MATQTVQQKSETPETAHRRLGLNRLVAIIGWIALAAFVVITVVPGLLGDKVFASTGIYLESPSYWEAYPDNVVDNVLVSDTVDSILPKTILFRDRIADGDFPFWNPYQVGGGELGGLPNGAFLSPLTLPFLILPISIAPAVVKLLEIAVIAIGCSLFLRRLRMPSATWPIATLIFASSGFMVVWTNWPQTRVAALIPLAFWATERLVATQRWRDVPILAVVIATMWLGGFPAITFNTLYAIAVYAIVRVFGQASHISLVQIGQVLLHGLRLAVAVCLSVGIAAIHLLPFVMNSRDMINFEARDYKGVALIPEAVSSYVLPFIMGSPQGRGFWSMHGPVESVGYVGIAAIVLSLLAVLGFHSQALPRGVFSYFAAAVIVLTVAVYWGGPMLSAIQLLPTLDVSLFARMRSVIGFMLAVLAAFGFSMLLSPKKFAVRLDALTPWNVVRACIVLIIAAEFLISLRAANMHAPESYTNRLWLLGTIYAGGILVAFIVCSWIVKKSWFVAIGAFVVIVTVVAPGTYFAHKWWPIRDAESLFPENEVSKYLEQNIGDDRYLSFSNAVYMGSNTAYGVRSFGGRGFMTPEWRDILTTADIGSTRGVMRTPTYALFDSGSIDAVSSSGVLDRFGVKFLVLRTVKYIPGVEEQLYSGHAVRELKAGETAFSGEITGPVRGFRLYLSGSADPDLPYVELEVVARDSEGEVLWDNGQIIRNYTRDVYIGADLDELEAERVFKLEIKLNAPPGAVDIAEDDAGQVALDVIRPADDGLNVKYADEVMILERESNMGRIRWADGEIAIDDAAARLQAMGNGSIGREVVLDHSADLRRPLAFGSAEISVIDTGDIDSTELRIDSDGPGWVVIADSTRRNGWVATLNGEEVELVDAEHAAAAVYVPNAGEHTLLLTFESPGFKLGGWVSLASIAVGLVLFAASWARGKQKRGRSI